MAGLFRNLSFLAYGTKHFGKDGYARAAKHFDPSVMGRRLDGKVCLVTGANQGLGLQAAQELAARGATLLMVCRNPEKGQKAVDDIRSKTGNQNVHLKVCDISSLKAIRQLADDLKATQPHLHVLINNAGVMVGKPEKSVDGMDLNTATNTVGAWALTLLLEPLLKRGAPSKVIFFSSGGMYTQKLEVEDFQNEHMGKHYDGTTAYAKDKRRQVAIVERLSEMWQAQGIHVYAMHPGWADTGGVADAMPAFYKFYKNKFRDVPQGADTAVYLALEDDNKLTPGGFYLDRKPQVKHLSLAGTHYDSKQVDQLWAKLQRVVPEELFAPAAVAQPPQQPPVTRIQE